MPRPRMPIGSHGTIRTDEVTPGLWRARTLYRFPDGKRRQVQRVRPGKTPSRAVQALREALVDAASPATGEIKPSTRISVLCEEFLDSKRQAGKASRTISTYEHNIRSVIVPRIGDLRLEEATAGRLQAFFNTVTREHGPGAAKGCRSVLSGAFGLAVRRDALRSNPVLAVEGIAQPKSKASTALPLDEVPRFIATVQADEELQRLDLADVLVFMLYSGCRIGEACALRWARVDLDAAAVTFAATAVRVPGEGMLLQEHGKTTSSTRTIALPPEAVALLAARPRDSELVFPSPLGKLRDISNTNGTWQRNRDRLGYPNLTSHALRKTCATALDVAGLSARGIAEFLGHRRPSMTQDVYMSRNVGSAEAAKHLSRMFGVSSDRVVVLRARSA